MMPATPPMLGMPVVVSPALPIHPGHKEDARRLVRHGMADVLAWLGQDVGPEPGEPTHAMRAGSTVLVSPDLHQTLAEEALHA